MDKKKMILTSLASVAVLGAAFAASQPSVVKAEEQPAASQSAGDSQPTPAAETPKTEVEKAKEAEAAGADYVGDSELAQKIQGGWFEFDVIVATPDMMGEVGRLGRVLGPKGLMPNPKTGTVTMDVTKAVEEIKAGKVTYRVDKAGNIHVPIGKVSFSDEKLVENFKTIHETLLRIKPATVKGQYVRNVAVTTTFGPGVKVDVASL